MLLFPTIAVVAWLPEFLRPRFGTTCGTGCGFDTQDLARQAYQSRTQFHRLFLRPRFGTTCGTGCGFDTLGAPDLAFSPECPGSSLQFQRGGLPCPDHPLYSCVRFLILNES